MDRAKSPSVPAGDGRNVNDHAGAFLEHFRNDRLSGEKRALGIEINYLVPPLLCHLERLKAFYKRASIVDKYVNGAEFYLNLADHLLDLRIVRYVGLDRDGRAGNGIDGRICAGFVVVIRDRDRPTAPAEIFGSRAADAAGRSGHENDLAFEIKRVMHIYLVKPS